VNFGIEESQIELAMEKYDLYNDEDYKKLIQGLMNAFEEKIMKIKQLQAERKNN
jgi:hypothetical protein